MDEGENTFPMDVDRDPSSRPWKFRPEGYLVVILAGEDEGKQAEAALVAAGLAAQDVKLYAGKADPRELRGVQGTADDHGEGRRRRRG